MDRGKVDVVQIDVTRVGGLTEARKIAWDAQMRLLPVANHSFTTDINVAASLHLLASIPNTIFLEFCVESSVFRDELTTRQIEPVQGMVRIPESPGLSVDINEDVIARYRVK